MRECVVKACFCDIVKRKGDGRMKVEERRGEDG